MVKDLPANARDVVLIPGPGRFLMPRGNLACVAQLLELSHSRACAPQQEKPLQ